MVPIVPVIPIIPIIPIIPMTLIVLMVPPMGVCVSAGLWSRSGNYIIGSIDGKGSVP